jgi:hypothetical protein
MKVKGKSEFRQNYKRGEESMTRGLEGSTQDNIEEYTGILEHWKAHIRVYQSDTRSIKAFMRCAQSTNKSESD